MGSGPPEGSHFTSEGGHSYASARCQAMLHEYEALSRGGGPLRVTSDGKVSCHRASIADLSQRPVSLPSPVLTRSYARPLSPICSVWV